MFGSKRCNIWECTSSTAMTNGGTDELFVYSVMSSHFLLKNLFNRQDLSRTPLTQTAFPAQTCFFLKSLLFPWGDSKGACIFMTGACIVVLQLQAGKHVPNNPSLGESLANTSAWCRLARLHRRPCRKIDFGNNGCVVPAGECSLFKNDSWKPSHLRGGQIHNAEFPRGSTCLLIQARTHTFLSLHTHTACRASGGCCCGGARCRVGPLLGRGSLFPLSWALLPSDDGPIVHASSGPAPFRATDKAPFHKTKAGEQGGKQGERGEEGSDGSVERQRRWEGEMQWEEERVKGRRERVVMEEGVLEGWAGLVRFFWSWT